MKVILIELDAKLREKAVRDFSRTAYGELLGWPVGSARCDFY